MLEPWLVLVTTSQYFPPLASLSFASILGHLDWTGHSHISYWPAEEKYSACHYISIINSDICIAKI